MFAPAHDPSTDFSIAPARLTVDLGALVANWRAMARASGAAEASAVVKADAYGLGIEPVGRALVEAGCRTFFVASVPEGVALRAISADARIFVLNGVWDGWEQMIHRHRLIPVLSSAEQLAFHHANLQGLPFALGIDTGMNRMGLRPEDALSLASDSGPWPSMVMSHLACPDLPDHPLNRRQLESFQTVTAAYDGIESSLSSSAAILLGTDYHFDLTRPGIALYGGNFGAGSSSLVRPVVTAEARILQIRDVPAGETVSYGATQTMTRNSRVAIVGAGYADGWHRALSGAGVPLRANGTPGGEVVAAGLRVPIIGRITMDLTMVDITDVPEGELRTGDYVSLFGHGISLDDAATAAGTIGYELLTSLGRRYVRRYIHPTA